VTVLEKERLPAPSFMATKRDYYEVLGVTKTALLADIKKAYRKLALEWHPDRNKAPNANEKFKEINEAYAVLSNTDKRSAYDQFGYAAFAPGGGFGARGAEGPFGGTYRQGPFTYSYSTGASGGASPFGGFGDVFDPFEIFEQFFGGGFSPRGARRREAYEITIDFMEAVKGTTKEVHLPRGRAGEGTARKTIKIPAGVESGSRIRFDDFDIVISVRPSREFQREDDDIFLEKEITFTQAALGTVIEVPTIDGPIKIRIQPGTQSGTSIRLRGKGAPHVRGGGLFRSEASRGDEYVRITLRVPTRLNRRQKELLEELSRID